MSQVGSASIAGTPVVPTQFTTNSGIAIPVAHNLNVLGSAGATTSGSGSTITITVSGAGFTWNVVTSASNPITLIPENGYISKGGTQVVFALPLIAAVGDTYKLVGYGNLFKVSQNADQSISLGFSTTTVGVTGDITATAARDTMEIVCVKANFEFQIVSCVGNPSFT
jgi:hypothetical protein